MTQTSSVGVLLWVLPKFQTIESDTAVMPDAYSKGDIFNLNMGLLKVANSTPIAWKDVRQVPWDSNDYQPTMALAQNHVHFLGVPGVSDGSAKIFVIHCALPRSVFWMEPYGFLLFQMRTCNPWLSATAISQTSMVRPRPSSRNPE
jgi:hypothetical protein